MMNVTDLEARVRRLDELARGLAKEVALWKDGTDPLLYLERRMYLNAIMDALAGMEQARVVLAQARGRMEQRQWLDGAGPGGTGNVWHGKRTNHPPPPSVNGLARSPDR